MTPLQKYAQVILHSGCAIPPIGEFTSRKHTWDECRDKWFYMRLARKHQHKLQSCGLSIGKWIHKKDIDLIKEQKGDYLGLIDYIFTEWEDKSGGE